MQMRQLRAVLSRRGLTTPLTSSIHVSGSLVGRNASTIQVGDSATHETLISESKVLAFADLTGDRNPIHIDEAAASKSRFKRRIAHGFLFASAIPTLFAHSLPGSVYIKQAMKFNSPVYLEEVVRTTLTVTRVEPKPRNIGTIVQCSTACEVQRNNSWLKVLEGSAEVLIPPSAP